MQETDGRKDDIIVAALAQKFSDFVERYDRDVGALNEWRKHTDKELDAQGVILRDISPAYTRGKWIVGLIMVGSVGMAVKSFWAHIAWK